MNYKILIGKNLQIARKNAGMTQKQVAVILKKYQPDYSQYERGIIELNYEQIVILCRLFNIEPNELFYGLY